MEDLEFENNIKEAFKRLNRTKLKAKMNEVERSNISEELVFESNITEAGRRIQRDKMKAILQKAETESDLSIRLPEKKNTWWKYAVAACLIVGLGVAALLYSISEIGYSAPPLSKNENRSEERILKDDTIQKETASPVIQDNRKKAKSNKINITEQDFNVTIKSENLGFSNAEKLNVQVRIEQGSNKAPTYTYLDKKLTVFSSKTLKIESAISLNDKLYLKVGKLFYSIENNKNIQPFTEVMDSFLIQKLDKIDFTNSGN
jgi:hypothetical protein